MKHFEKIMSCFKSFFQILFLIMFEIILLGLLIVFFLALIFLINKVFSLRERIKDLKFEKSSQSVKYGKLTEQFIPFAETFPFNPEKFRFLGNPIDGIVFLENEIIFCEFKTGSSQLSQKQRQIKQLVNEKKVKWFEFGIR